MASRVEARSKSFFPDGTPTRAAQEASNVAWAKNMRARLEQMQNEDVIDRVRAAWLEDFRDWVAAARRD